MTNREFLAQLNDAELAYYITTIIPKIATRYTLSSLGIEQWLGEPHEDSYWYDVYLEAFRSGNS